MKYKLQSIASLLVIFLCTNFVSAQSFKAAIAKMTSPEVSSHLQMKKSAAFNPDSSLNYAWVGNQFDSIYYSIYTYDAAGRLTMQVNKSVGGIITGRVTNTYDANGNILVYMEEDYDLATQSYIPDYKSVSVFDAKGDRVSGRAYSYDQNSMTFEMDYGDSIQITYDGSNRQVGAIMLSWDNNGGTWEVESKITAMYNGSATSPSSISTFDWDGSAWEESFRADNITWGLGYGGISFADDAPEPTVYRSYDFDVNGAYPSRYDSSVLVNGKLMQSLGFDWDGTTIDPSDRANYVYDSEGNQFSLVYETFDGNNWKVTYGDKDSAIYGTLGQTLETYQYYYDNNDASWKPIARVKNFFAPNVSVKANVLAGMIRIYPNPAVNVIHFDNTAGTTVNAKVYSVQGNEVFSIQLEEGLNTVNTSTWNNGVYVIRMESNQGIATQKVIIR